MLYMSFDCMAKVILRLKCDLRCRRDQLRKQLLSRQHQSTTLSFQNWWIILPQMNLMIFVLVQISLSIIMLDPWSSPKSNISVNREKKRERKPEQSQHMNIFGHMFCCIEIKNGDKCKFPNFVFSVSTINNYYLSRH